MLPRSPKVAILAIIGTAVTDGTKGELYSLVPCVGNRRPAAARDPFERQCSRSRRPLVLRAPPIE